MIDKEHDSINCTALISWIVMIVIGGTWWYLLFTAWFQTIMWTIVVVAALGIIVKIKEHVSMFIVY